MYVVVCVAPLALYVGWTVDFDGHGKVQAVDGPADANVGARGMLVGASSSRNDKRPTVVAGAVLHDVARLRRATDRAAFGVDREYRCDVAGGYIQPSCDWSVERAGRLSALIERLFGAARESKSRILDEMDPTCLCGSHSTGCRGDAQSQEGYYDRYRYRHCLPCCGRRNRWDRLQARRACFPRCPLSRAGSRSHQLAQIVSDFVARIECRLSSDVQGYCELARRRLSSSYIPDAVVIRANRPVRQALTRRRSVRHAYALR